MPRPSPSPRPSRRLGSEALDAELLSVLLVAIAGDEFEEVGPLLELVEEVRVLLELVEEGWSRVMLK